MMGPKFRQGYAADASCRSAHACTCIGIYLCSKPGTILVQVRVSEIVLHQWRDLSLQVGRQYLQELLVQITHAVRPLSCPRVRCACNPPHPSLSFTSVLLNINTASYNCTNNDRQNTAVAREALDLGMCLSKQVETFREDSVRDLCIYWGQITRPAHISTW